MLWPTVLVPPCTPPWSPVFCGTRLYGRKLRTRSVKQPHTWKAIRKPRLGLQPNFTKIVVLHTLARSAVKGSVRRLTGRLVLAVAQIERTFFQQFFKFCPSLVNEGSGKSAGRLLPFSGQILYSHVEQRDVLFKPAQGFLHAGNSEISRKHRVTHRQLLRLPCFRRNASLKLNTCGTRFATTVSETRYCGSDGWSRRNPPAGKEEQKSTGCCLGGNGPLLFSQSRKTARQLRSQPLLQRLLRAWGNVQKAKSDVSFDIRPSHFCFDLKGHLDLRQHKLQASRRAFGY